MKPRKSWLEKLADCKGLPKIARITGKMTINEIRAALARTHGVDFACPITTGIFAWIAAHAAAEAASAGRKRITSYWRTLKAGGQLNEKYPGGVAALKQRLKAEGHKIVKQGKRYLVAEFEKSLHYRHPAPSRR